MDEDTRHFLENIHHSLERKIDAALVNVATKDDLANLATKQELAELGDDLRTRFLDLRKAALTYSAHVERLLRDFGTTQYDFSVDLADLKYRVAELERRLPPETAA